MSNEGLKKIKKFLRYGSWLMGIRASSLSKPKLPLFSWTPIKPEAPQHPPDRGGVGGGGSGGGGRCVRSVSEPSLWSGGGEAGAGAGGRRCRPRHRRSRTPRHKQPRFGYEITDIDAFLTKASIETPGNIPVVLSTPCQLYQTQVGGYQEEVSLPLGMVVNAVFKNQSWLYVQTPHGEEGYVRYAACLPLGILPPRHETAPCWESHSDIFPKPQGAARSGGGSRSECARSEVCLESHVDRLYLQAVAANSNSNSNSKLRPSRRQLETLVVVGSDYKSRGPSSLTVTKGDVVALLSSRVKDWFWVRDRDGNEGFIPAQIAGHGFL